MKKTFLNSEKPIITVMVQADNPDRIKELIDKLKNKKLSADEPSAESFFSLRRSLVNR